MIAFGSVCSGIGCADLAFQRLGWRGAFMSEIEAFPRAVLCERFPAVPLHGDFTTIKAGDYAAIDLLVGGTPCQSFSVAGLRGGLADERGNLALEYLRLAGRLRPRWLVWENVPGVLSSGGGRDFGAFVGGLAELGYGWAYRASAGAQCVAFDLAQITSAANRTRAEAGLPAGTLTKNSAMHVAAQAVRRLTPREAERLQGLPDDWTLIVRAGRPAADAPRYKAIGNGMAVPVLEWIGRRIARQEAEIQADKEVAA